MSSHNKDQVRMDIPVWVKPAGQCGVVDAELYFLYPLTHSHISQRFFPVDLNEVFDFCHGMHVVCIDFELVLYSFVVYFFMFDVKIQCSES